MFGISCFKNLLVDANSQPSATFAAAIGEDFASTQSGHAGTKTVRTESADIVWLIGTFHRTGVKSMVFTLRQAFMEKIHIPLVSFQ